ncbi:hypothetical protein MKS88_001023 [Plasmodium brasilianum]|uniref:Uncharacterized protein n=2 Tax=Plasmodium (Plasmodium) TaxID=418103 RepID=A0A1A8X350_PLAMA|nr:conserved Plasmodium protein, unknown function [Plasmodium malariae]KAI4840788.1 hypothetical protein MKS88_001023 [Plasmodium brasilianum]SBS99680.1 conserved Plasmodium protein, unknown function [Plasmodium malariae]SBT86353.1 conserved Plasmodium protein, unknown function [Plasmodium malariae]
MQKFPSKKLNDENIDSIIKNEKTINENLTKENEKIKEKNIKIQQQLLSYIEDNNFIYESGSSEDIQKYKQVLNCVIEYMNKLKIVDGHMKKEIFNLLEEFFQCIKEAIIKQNDLCFLINEDMNYFKISGKEEMYKKNLLTLRKIYEHNSILRAQICLFNKFKLKNENLIHADFEQLELKYKNLKSKESILEKKIENLNNKIRKSTEKKLHYDEKNLYLEKVLDDKTTSLEESYNSIRNKKNMMKELKKKKDESIKKYNEAEICVITKNVYEEFQAKKQHLGKLKAMLEKLKKEYESLNKMDVEE